MKDIKNFTLVVGGLARDCEYNLNKNLKDVYRLRGEVKELFICILENDSSDKTALVMDEFAKSHTNVIVKHFKETEFAVDNKTGASMSRICRLAKYRNILLDLMDSCCPNPDYNVIIDWDLDEMNSLQILRAIENAPSNWGALFADGRYKWQLCRKLQTGFRDKRKIYDSFAVLEDDKSILSILPLDNTSYHKFIIAEKYGTLLNKNKYVSCNSAFGGIGIYKHEAIKGCKYTTTAIENWFVCEHISFH